MFDILAIFPEGYTPTDPTMRFVVPPRENDTVGALMDDGRRHWFKVSDAVHFPHREGHTGYVIHLRHDPGPPRRWMDPVGYNPSFADDWT